MNHELWTPERIEEMRQLWPDGHSAAKVAKKLMADGSPPVTRNAVIAKCYRLGFESGAMKKASAPRLKSDPAPKSHSWAPRTHKNQASKAIAVKAAKVAVEKLQQPDIA